MFYRARETDKQIDREGERSRERDPRFDLKSTDKPGYSTFSQLVSQDLVGSEGRERVEAKRHARFLQCRPRPGLLTERERVRERG